MYDVNKITLGETLREYRKMKNMTLQDVGEKVCKSKVTICKYENNEVLPDFYTLLELCNTLDINITQLCQQVDNVYTNDENPFNKNKLYVYYYTTNKVVGSVIELEKNEDKYKVKFFNGMKKDHKKYTYYYEGDMINDKKITYFDLNIGNNRFNEKIQIIINVPWSENTEIYNGLYTGMTRNGLPVVKKAILSKYELSNFDKYENQLKFSKEESKMMYKENALIFSNIEYDEYL